MIIGRQRKMGFSVAYLKAGSIRRATPETPETAGRTGRGGSHTAAHPRGRWRSPIAATGRQPNPNAAAAPLFLPVLLRSPPAARTFPFSPEKGERTNA
ncbi:MAG: hypothetical protein BJ554DRAFT_2029, partial [Olpidium bornovanus]